MKAAVALGRVRESASKTFFCLKKAAKKRAVNLDRARATSTAPNQQKFGFFSKKNVLLPSPFAAQQRFLHASRE